MMLTRFIALPSLFTAYSSISSCSSFLFLFSSLSLSLPLILLILLPHTRDSLDNRTNPLAAYLGIRGFGTLSMDNRTKRRLGLDTFQEDMDARRRT
jgi:hypothetical protein